MKTVLLILAGLVVAWLLWIVIHFFPFIAWIFLGDD